MTSILVAAREAAALAHAANGPIAAAMRAGDLDHSATVQAAIRAIEAERARAAGICRAAAVEWKKTGDKAMELDSPMAINWAAAADGRAETASRLADDIERDQPIAAAIREGQP